MHDLDVFVIQPVTLQATRMDAMHKGLLLALILRIPK